MAATIKRKTVEGWETYPACLGSSTSFQVEWDFNRNRVSEAASNLFTQNSGNSAVQVLTPVEQTSLVIDNPAALDRYLGTEDAQQVQIVFIHRKHSWSHLQVTEEMLMKLCTFYRVHPGFLSIILDYGARIRPNDGRLSSLKYESIRDVSWSFSYSLHYAQKHDRALRDPWSIRQTGFYQGYQNSGDFPVWILLQPSVDIQNALKKVVVSSSQHAEAALESHVIFTSAVSMRWSQYVEFLEHQYMERRNKGLMSSVGQNAQANTFHDFTVTFQDSQELQAFQEKLGRVLSALQYNSQVISSLQKKLQDLVMQNLRQHSNLKAKGVEISWFNRLDEVREETIKCQRNITALIKRAHGIETLLYRIHDFRSIQLANQLATDLKQLGEQQRSEGERMIELTNRTAQDASTMKIITSVTFVYLPATFVATFFGMGYMQWVELGTPGSSFQVARELWVYAVVALPLTAITICAYFWWDHKVRARMYRVHRP